MAATAVVAAVSMASTSIATSVVASVIGSGVISSAVGMVGGAVVGNVVASAFSGGNQQQPLSVGSGSAQARGLLINNASNIDPLPVIYGSRRVGGTRVFVGASGAKNEYLHIVIALCEGEISAINTVYLDDVASTDARFAGLVTIEKYLGTDTQAASAQLQAAIPGWHADHQGKGVAYIYVRLKYDQDAFTGLPTITCDIDGKKVYDVRDGLVKFSANPALCVRDYLTSTRYGRGISSSLIDDASIIAAANHCDTLTTIPGGTQALYECTGVVNVDDTAYANMQRMLTSCRGMLIFSGGKYRLVIDKAETAGFAFSADNITGAWQFFPTPKRDKYNRISASFFNPDRAWQPDIAIQKSAAMLAEDNGLVLERKLDLPFVADLYRAQHIIQQELKQSRSGLVVRFTALQDGLRCEVGDVVTITHATPGWVNKTFRVMEIEIKDNDEVFIVAREYDASVYTLDALEAKPTAPATSLPNPYAVAAPGTPSVLSELYETRGGAGVKARATITCAAAPDIFVGEYQFEWKVAGAAAWTILGRSSMPSIVVADVAPGVYDVRAKAINTIGVSGAYAQRSGVEILGLAAPPAAITGLTLQAVGGLAILTWTLHPDLDVRIGGKIRIRHGQTGATWETSTSIGEAVTGNTTVAVLPLKGGTYLVRAEDSGGILSASYASINTKQATALAWSPLTGVQDDDEFSGTHSNTFVDGGQLMLSGAGSLDDIADFDSLASLDYYGGVATSGTYGFAAGIDLGSVQSVRLTGLLITQAENVVDYLDSRNDIDSWADFDGTLGAPVDAWIEVRETDDDPAGTPTWSAWNRLDAAEFSARAFDLRCKLVSNDPIYNIKISQLRVAVATVI